MTRTDNALNQFFTELYRKPKPEPEPMTATELVVYGASPGMEAIEAFREMQRAMQKALAESMSVPLRHLQIRTSMPRDAWRRFHGAKPLAPETFDGFEPKETIE